MSGCFLGQEGGRRGAGGGEGKVHFLHVYAIREAFKCAPPPCVASLGPPKTQPLDAWCPLGPRRQHWQQLLLPLGGLAELQGCARGGARAQPLPPPAAQVLWLKRPAKQGPHWPCERRCGGGAGGSEHWERRCREGHVHRVRAQWWLQGRHRRSLQGRASWRALVALWVMTVGWRPQGLAGRTHAPLGPPENARRGRWEWHWW